MIFNLVLRARLGRALASLPVKAMPTRSKEFKVPWGRGELTHLPGDLSALLTDKTLASHRTNSVGYVAVATYALKCTSPYTALSAEAPNREGLR